MKLIIAGSRTITDPDALSKAWINLEIPDNITEVVCGMAKGVDTLGQRWAIANEVRLKYFPANWTKNGRSAGPIRNQEMAEYADALLLIWDGTSKGSTNMKQCMEKLGKPIYELIIT